jgi:hypothetical protein
MTMMPGSNSYPQQGGAPKELTTLLATLMLNNRLRQKKPRRQPVGYPALQGTDGARMRELARMQLTSGPTGQRY